MQISLQWLLEFVDLEIVAPEPQYLGETLTGLGLAVDEIHSVGEDTIFDLDVTTNRPDCMNHLGIARELAAFFGLQLRQPDCEAPASKSDRLSASVHIEDPELCPRYAARVIEGVQIKASPSWLQDRLRRLGQRPVNNVVDVTNLVLLEMGHPMHAFDYDLLAKREIVVRRRQSGEQQFTTLDGQSRDLDDDTLLICDGLQPVALAGLMGGQSSEVSDSTVNLLLESAYFAPHSIRRTSKRLGLSTEASYRFERGADPEAPVRALNRCCILILELAGGVCSGPVIDEFPGRQERTQIELTCGRIRQVIGEELDPGFVSKTLELLGFAVSAQESGWNVAVPGFRVDTSIEDDLVEDLLRHHGYDAVATTYPPPQSGGKRLATQEAVEALLQALLGAGYSEAVNLAFSTPEAEAVFSPASQQLIGLSNPMSEDLTHLRGTLSAGLLAALRRNFNFGSNNVRLFELGETYAPGSPPMEEMRLGLVATGYTEPLSWQGEPEALNFFHLKGLIEMIFEVLEVEVVLEPAEYPFLHPGVSARIRDSAGNPIGWAGRLSQELGQKLNQPVFISEMSLDSYLEKPWGQPLFQELERFPSSDRDFSFLVDNEVRYGTIKDAIKALNIPELRDIQPIDFYHGPKLPAGKRSLTIRLTFANPERTLKQDEITAKAESVIERLRADFGAQLRS